LTVRGQTPEEFQRNLAAVRGLLDAPTNAPAQTPSANERRNAEPEAPAGDAWVCKYHGKGLPSKKVPGGRYCPAKMADGSHCKEQWSSK